MDRNDNFADAMFEFFSRDRRLTQHVLVTEIEKQRDSDGKEDVWRYSAAVDDSVLSRMSNGHRVTGRGLRGRVLAIIDAFMSLNVLHSVAEADKLLDAADLASLSESRSKEEQKLHERLTQRQVSVGPINDDARQPQQRRRGIVFLGNDEYLPLDMRFKHVTDVSVLAISAIAFVMDVAPYFLKRMQAGQMNLKMMLLDPSSSAAMYSPALINPFNKQRVEDIITAKRKLKPLLETKRLELLLTDIAPPFSLVLTDVDSPHGIVQVTQYGLEVTVVDTPHFLIERKDVANRRWFEYYCDQMEYFWQRGYCRPQKEFPDW